jgi:hypothetical protein
MVTKITKNRHGMKPITDVAAYRYEVLVNVIEAGVRGRHHRRQPGEMVAQNGRQQCAEKAATQPKNA